MHQISNRKLVHGLLPASPAPATLYVAATVFVTGHYQANVVLFLIIISILSSYTGALARHTPALLFLRKRRALILPNMLIRLFAIYLIVFLSGLLLNSHGELTLLTTFRGAVSCCVAALAFVVASGLHKRFPRGGTIDT